jgi:hypothetical protein
MRVALIHSEAGPAARRSLPIAHGLRDAGHEVTFVLPQAEPDTSLRGLALAWKAAGFAVIPVDTSTLVVAEDTFPRDPVFAVARALPQLVLAFDVAWFFEGKWAMTTLRERRFSGRQLPVIALEAPEAEPIPASLNEVNQAFARSYAQQWADICFEPTQPSAEAIQQLESLWSERSRSPEVAVPTSESLPAVTVCVPYFEQPEFLGETLLSLARQTSNAFTVIVVDDGLRGLCGAVCGARLELLAAGEQRSRCGQKLRCAAGFHRVSALPRRRRHRHADDGRALSARCEADRRRMPRRAQL